MLATARKDIDAKVVGSALVVSFLGADQPRVWRAEMTGLSTATFELREKGDAFSVVMRRDGSDENIVTFKDRESAAYTLQAMTAAMLKGDAGRGGASGSGALGKIVKGFIVLLAVVVALKLVLSPGGGPRPPMGMSGTERVPGALVKPGEPVPADQIFGGK